MPRFIDHPHRFLSVIAILLILAAPILYLTNHADQGIPTTGAAPTLAAPSAQLSHALYLPSIRSGLAPAKPTVTPPTALTATPPAPATPATALYFAGDNAWSGVGSKSVSDALLKDDQGPIQLGGDTVWDQASASQYAAYWTPTYGRISKQRFHPAYGNHDSNTPSQYASYWGTQAGKNGNFWYSYDVNAQWHVVVLNSLTNTSASSPQVAWLKQDLAANQGSGKCLIGVYHEPRYSSGEHGNNTSQQTLWATLANAGAAVVLNGHDHDYERFNPMDASGQPASTGIREFVVGTGGIPEYNTNNHGPQQAKFIMNEFGYLKLSLGDKTYSWEFIPTSGGTAKDAGSGSCTPM